MTLTDHEVEPRSSFDLVPPDRPAVACVAQLAAMILGSIDPTLPGPRPIQVDSLALVRRWATARLVVVDVPTASALAASHATDALPVWRGDLPTVLIYPPSPRPIIANRWRRRVGSEFFDAARAVGATHLVPEGDHDPCAPWLEYVAALLREQG